MLPTVCQLTGVRTGAPCDGVSLVPLLRGEDLVRHIPIMASTHPGDKAWPVRSCVVADGWKYIEPVRANPGQDWEYAVHEQLYRVAGDQGETEECAANLPEQTRRAAERLREGLALAAPLVADTHDRREPADSAALQAQLRALGYVRSE
jgi:arylsulfatase A-like enzyme